MPSRFPSFPACCQPLLEELEREGKGGARNCAKGHLISLEYARQIEAERARTEAEEARKAAEAPQAQPSTEATTPPAKPGATAA